MYGCIHIHIYVCIWVYICIWIYIIHEYTSNTYIFTNVIHMYVLCMDMVDSRVDLRYACVSVCACVYVCMCVCECVDSLIDQSFDYWCLSTQIHWYSILFLTFNAATHCNTLQHTATHCNTVSRLLMRLHTYLYGFIHLYWTCLVWKIEFRCTVQICMYVSMSMCVCVFRCACTSACVYVHVYVYMCAHICIRVHEYFIVCIHVYVVATISRLLKIIGLFCKRALWKRLYSAARIFAFVYMCTLLCVYMYMGWLRLVGSLKL